MKNLTRWALFIALSVVSLYYITLVSAGSSPSKSSKRVPLAHWRQTVSLYMPDNQSSHIALRDGHDLVTAYEGSGELVQAMESNQARPLALTSSDFNKDGIADLLASYESSGRGIIALHRGNADFCYPHSPEAEQHKADGTFTDAPFLSPAALFSLPEAVDFIGAGDFDADGDADVVAAKQGSDKLYFLEGDGQSGLTLSRTMALLGAVTAFAIGEMNRRDGLEEVVVAVKGQQGAKVLVFESPDGAFEDSPEEFALPAEASSLALGQLDNEANLDLAVAAGRGLVIIHGRDRKLSLSQEQQATV